MTGDGLPRPISVAVPRHFSTEAQRRRELRFDSVHSVFVCYNAVVVEKTSSPDSSSKRSRRLKIIGVIVLLFGISSACLVYWMGTRSPNLSDDLSMVGFNKAESRQMGMLYGKMGLLIEDWINELKRPGTQATLIASASILIAFGCFYFARLSDDVDKTG
jgi:hypothetical protein